MERIPREEKNDGYLGAKIVEGSGEDGKTRDIAKDNI